MGLSHINVQIAPLPLSLKKQWKKYPQVRINEKDSGCWVLNCPGPGTPCSTLFPWLLREKKPGLIPQIPPPEEAAGESEK